MLNEEVNKMRSMMGLNEISANTDLELKKAAKDVFATLKKYGLNPNYTSSEARLDKNYDSVVSVIEDSQTGTGLIKVNIWAWAVSKSKIDMKKLNDDIQRILGGDFESKSGQTSVNNDIVYVMLIRKKGLQNEPIKEAKGEFWAIERPNGEVVKHFESEKEAQAWIHKNDPEGMVDYNIRQIEESIEDDNSEDMEMISLSMAAMSHLSDLQEVAPELSGKINFVKALIMKMNNKEKISSEELDALYTKYVQ